MKEKSFLEIESLTVVYNEHTPNEIKALDNFSLSVDKGEILVITGGNGSGKSTLLHAINGTIPLKSGKILINGIDITNWSSNKRAKLLNMVHQDTMLGTCPTLSIQENFEIINTSKWWLPIPYNLKLNSEQTENLTRIGLDLSLRGISKINTLSGGQRQAIAVCLAFGNKKPLLLFDEFTSALDERIAKNILDFTIEKAHMNESTLLMVMHNMQHLVDYNFKTISIE